MLLFKETVQHNFIFLVFFQPSLSVGNVGQLAVDILLATLRPQLVAAIDHPALLPVVGSDPLEQNSDRLMTAGEGDFKRSLSNDQKLLFQTRSPFRSV